MYFSIIISTNFRFNKKLCKKNISLVLLKIQIASLAEVISSWGFHPIQERRMSSYWFTSTFVFFRNYFKAFILWIWSISCLFVNILSSFKLLKIRFFLPLYLLIIVYTIYVYESFWILFDNFISRYHTKLLFELVLSFISFIH